MSSLGKVTGIDKLKLLSEVLNRALTPGCDTPLERVQFIAGACFRNSKAVNGLHKACKKHDQRPQTEVTG